MNFVCQNNKHKKLNILFLIKPICELTSGMRLPVHLNKIKELTAVPSYTLKFNRIPNPRKFTSAYKLDLFGPR